MNKKLLSIMILLSLTLLAACGNGKKDTAETQNHEPTTSEIKTAQSSVSATIPRENARTKLLGTAMLNYIISQKKGLIDAMPEQLKTYSYEDEEAIDANTIVVTYRARNQLNPTSITSQQIAVWQENYVKGIQFILQEMKKAGVKSPKVKSIHQNKDGSYLYTLHAEFKD